MNPLLRAMYYTHYYLRFNGTALILISTEHCVSPRKRCRSLDDGIEKARKNSPTAILSIYRTHPLPPVCIYPILCFPGNTANSVRELCNRSLFCNSSHRLLNGAHRLLSASSIKDSAKKISADSE